MMSAPPMTLSRWRRPEFVTPSFVHSSNFVCYPPIKTFFDRRMRYGGGNEIILTKALFFNDDVNYILKRFALS